MKDARSDEPRTKGHMRGREGGDPVIAKNQMGTTTDSPTIIRE